MHKTFFQRNQIVARKNTTFRKCHPSISRSPMCCLWNWIFCKAISLYSCSFSWLFAGKSNKSDCRTLVRFFVYFANRRCSHDVVEYTHHQFHHVNCDTLMPVYSLYLSASSFVSSRVSGLHFLVFSLCLSAFVDSRLDRLTCFRGGDIIQARNCY